jgi:hypothetical protein
MVGVERSNGETVVFFPSEAICQRLRAEAIQHHGLKDPDELK